MQQRRGNVSRQGQTSHRRPAYSSVAMACHVRLVGAVTGIAESQVEVDAGQILEAAVPAVTFWPHDPLYSEDC
jgi:hypothetical protein